MTLTTILTKKVYPVLKPGDWMGLRNGAFRQTMIAAPDEPPIFVAFGYGAAAEMVYLMQHDVSGLDPDDILRQAFENLEEYSTDFERSAFLNGQLLTCTGSEYCSEKILSRTFMKRAHELLAAPKLLVSIPRRRGMMVIGQTTDADLLNTFMYLHGHAWRDDTRGDPRITDMLFIVEDGRIVGGYRR